MFAQGVIARDEWAHESVPVKNSTPGQNQQQVSFDFAHDIERTTLASFLDNEGS